MRFALAPTLTLMIAAGAAPVFGDQADPAVSLRWKNPAVETGLTPLLGAMPPIGEPILVRLASTPNTADRAALTAAGLHLLAPLGGATYFARIDGENNNAEAIGAAILEAGPITAAMKLHPALDADEPEAWITLPGLDGADERLAINVVLHADRTTDLDAIDAVTAAGGTVRDAASSVRTLVVEAPAESIREIVRIADVQWIEPALPPMGPAMLNDGNRALTRADVVQGPAYSLDGAGVDVMVFDVGLARTSHADFTSRVLTYQPDASLTSHASHVAGTVAGAGVASEGKFAGMAPAATIHSWTFEQGSGGIHLYDNPGNTQQAYTDAIALGPVVISNNSISTNVSSNGFNCSIMGDYGVTSALIDNIVRGDLGRPMIVFWAGGNERSSSRCRVSGMGDYFTVPPPSTAKNNIAVGAVNSDTESMTDFSSWGPTEDGRLHPHIVAPGCEVGGVGRVTSIGHGSDVAYATMCGTSMAAPTAAGLGALLVQDYRARFPGKGEPTNAMVKAVFAHSAVDLFEPGPDYKSGYGSVRINTAVDQLRSGNLAYGSVDQGQTRSFRVNVPAGSDELKVTVAWDDPPATPNTIPSLINDLDLRLIDPDGLVHYPWRLDPQNPSSPATRDGPNRIDNIEQVWVSQPTPGEWRAEVVGFDVPEGPQGFSIVGSPDLAASGVSLFQTEELPAFVAAAEETPLHIRLSVYDDELVADSARLHYRTAGGAFQSVPLQQIDGDLHAGSLPGLGCEGQVEYYFSAEGVEAGLVTYPKGGESDPLFADIGQWVDLFYDDFDTDTGWQVGAPDDTATSGVWTRMISEPTAAQPGTSIVGEKIWVTDGRKGLFTGTYAVSGGATTLFSPVFDLADHPEAEISYWRWYSNNRGFPSDDVFEIDISFDGGQTWAEAESFGPTGAGSQGGWFFSQWTISDIGVPTDSVQLRFVASDFGSPSIIEAALDAFLIREFVCEGAASCPPDLNGDGVVDADDFFLFLQLFAAGDQRADFNSDGVIDADDFFAFLTAFAEGC